MNDLVHVRFDQGFDVLFEGDLTWTETRLKGMELAKEKNMPVRMYAYNEPLSQWDLLGTDYPNGLTVDSWGDTLKLKPDGSGYVRIKEK